MLTVEKIIEIINECRIASEQGLGNGTKAILDEITVDFLKPPSDFLGVHKNPAIFINTNTYKYLRKFHENWIVNRTIAVKIGILDYPKINIIGIIAHEIGHAFNIAASINNSENNAYIFEIEILARWFVMKNKVLSDVSKEALLDYFKTRLPYYKQSRDENDYLIELLRKIENSTILESPTHVKLIQPHDKKLIRRHSETSLFTFFKKSADDDEPVLKRMEKRGSCGPLNNLTS